MFKWVEEGVLEQVQDVIPIINNMSDEINGLKGVIEELKGDAKVHKMQVMKWKLGSSVIIVWLCLITIMIFYLMFGKANDHNLLVW